MKRLFSVVAFAIIAGAVTVVAFAPRGDAGVFNPSITGTVAPGQVPFTALAHRSTPGVVAGDNNFWWDNTNKRLGVGTNSPTYALDVRRSVAGEDVMVVRNTSATGLSTIRLEDEDGGAAPLGIGHNNANDTGYLHRGQNVPFKFTEDDDANPGTADATDATINADGSLTWERAVTVNGVLTAAGGISGTISASSLSVDSPTFVVDATNDRVGMGIASPVRPLDVRSGIAAGHPAGVTSTNADGFSAILYNDNAVAFKGSFGWGNASLSGGNAQYAGKLHTRLAAGVEYIIADDTNVYGRVSSTNGVGFRGFNDQSILGTAATTDATVTTCGSFTPTDNRVVQMTTLVIGRRSTGAEGAGYEVAATFRITGGAVTQIGTTTALTTHESVAGWDATIDTSGGAIRNRVTGAAATTVAWNCYTQLRYVQ